MGRGGPVEGEGSSSVRSRAARMRDFEGPGSAINGEALWRERFMRPLHL